MNNGEDSIQLETMEADVSAPPTTLVRRTLFKGGALSAFGHRDFLLLWSGAFLSNVGTLIHMTALLWFVKVTTGSNAWVAVVNLANLLPILLFVLYAGSLADRLNRKKLIVATQAVMMLGALALAVCMTMHWVSLGVIVAITAVMGVAFAFNFPAWRAMVPDLVPREDMLNGVALDSAGYNMARFVGPTLGALIVSVWSVSAAFYINALSFLAVIGALVLIRTKTPSYPPHPEGTGRHMLEGIRYVLRNRWAANLLVALGISSFFGIPYIVLLPAFARDVLHKGAWGYGLLLGLTGLGAVVAAPTVTFINRYLKEREIIKFSVAGFGILLICFSISRTYWLSLIIATGMGAGYLMGSASVNTVLQSRVERDMRGRMMSFYILVFQGMFPVGGLVMGLVADARSAPFALFIGGAVCLALGAVLILVPSLLRDAVSPEGPGNVGAGAVGTGP